MKRAVAAFQLGLGLLLGVLPAAGFRVAFGGTAGIAQLPGVFLAVVSALVPAVASLYSWERHPYIAGGIIGGVTLIGGPLSPFLGTAAYGLLSW